MTTPIVYVICAQNCRYEGMTKEQILTAIMQAVKEGTIGNIDAGFITTIKTINGVPLKFFVGEQADYDKLTDEDKKDLFAIITNDTTKEGIEQTIKELQAAAKTAADHAKHKFLLQASATITSGRGVINKALDAGVYLITFGDTNFTRSGVGYIGANEGNLNSYNIMLGDLILVYNEVAGKQAEAVLVPSCSQWNGTDKTTDGGTLKFYRIGTI